MLEVVLGRKEDICSAGEKEEDALKERENTWEKGRGRVRGRAHILAQVRNSLGVKVLKPYLK